MILQLSQAATCDRVLYEMIPDGNTKAPPQAFGPFRKKWTQKPPDCNKIPSQTYIMLLFIIDSNFTPRLKY